MVDYQQVKKEMIMQKFTFTVELVHGSDIDTSAILDALAGSVDGITTYQSVDYNGHTALSEQGLKVWAKRKLGLSLASPKPVKAAKPAKAEAEVAETVGA